MFKYLIINQEASIVFSTPHMSNIAYMFVDVYSLSETHGEAGRGSGQRVAALSLSVTSHIPEMAAISITPTHS